MIHAEFTYHIRFEATEETFHTLFSNQSKQSGYSVRVVVSLFWWSDVVTSHAHKKNVYAMLAFGRRIRGTRKLTCGVSCDTTYCTRCHGRQK